MGIDASMVKDGNGRKVYSAVFSNLNPMHCDENNKRTGGYYYFQSTDHSTGSTVGIAEIYFKNSLSEYEAKINKLPKKIVVYRDGINDGDVSIKGF